MEEEREKLNAKLASERTEMETLRAEVATQQVSQSVINVWPCMYPQLNFLYTRLQEGKTHQ